MSVRHKELLLIYASLFAVLFCFAGAATAEEKDKKGVWLDEVVITAPQMEEPLVVETDPKAPRQPVPAHDGADYLKNITGFSVVRKGGTDGDPVFRGMAASRLNILLDGQYILGGCGGRMDPPTAYVFPESYDSIKVLKGPQSVIYGSSIAGAVLFERKPEYFEKPGIRASGSLMFGSFGRNDQSLDAAAGAEQGYVNVIGTRSDANDYKDGDGKTVHSSYTRWSLSGIAGWRPAKNTLIELTVDRSDGEAAYADRGMDGTLFDRTGFGIKLERTAISSIVSKVLLQGYYNYVDHIMDNYSMRSVSPGKYSLNNPDRKTVGARLAGDIVLSDKTVATVGADYQNNEHTLRSWSNQSGPIDVDSKPRLPDMTFSTVGVFGELTHQLSQKDRIIAGLRGDFTDIDNERTTGSGANSSVSDNTYSGFIRYEHDLNSTPVTIYAGLGHAERPADWWERNRDFFLNPEKNTQLDAGILYKSSKVRASLSVFYAKLNDFVLVKNDNTARNIDAETYGGEAELAYMFIKNWKATATLSYLHGDNDTDDKPLAQTPPLEGRIGLNYDNNVFAAGMLLRLVATQDRYHAGYGTIVGQDIGETPGFGVLSVNASYKPKKNILIAAGIDNLFDKTYAEHISKAGFAVAGYTQTTRVNEQGRTLWVKANYSF